MKELRAMEKRERQRVARLSRAAREDIEQRDKLILESSKREENQMVNIQQQMATLNQLHPQNSPQKVKA